MADEIVNKIGLEDLIEKEKLSDEDIFLIQDEENTKKVSFRDLRDSLIDDNELPSIHRMYSSQKLDEAIQNFQKQLDYDIGKVEGDINHLKENHIDADYVDEKIEEFSKEIPGLADVENIKKSLESKRNVTDMITCDDLEAGEDAKKIHLKNLSSEILEAMAGNSAITVPAVPEGGWVQEDIATGAINGIKLSKQYRYKGHYPEGNINNFTQDGLYLLGASVSGMPKYDENETDQDRLLEVYNYGPDQYIVQNLYYCLDNSENIRPVYRRRSLLSRLHVTDFIAEYPVTNTFKITRDILVDDVFNGGVVSEGNVYDLIEDKDYLVKKGVKNLPSDKYDFTVSVRNYGERREYSAKVITNEVCEIYISNSYLTSSGLRVFTEWKQTNTVTKSRLENKKLHLFGDGVCFGLGSSDIPNLSYPALLTSKYGIKIINHALGDATIGIYGDEYLEERSVIKQIENAQISDRDLAIIFAGSEDYKCGFAKMGSDTNINDYTFKGALNICIQKLMEKNPSIKLLIISPLFRARLDADDFRNSDDTPINELVLRDYANAMEDVCNYNHIPFLNLHNTSMINKYNFTVYLKDRLYLNDTGHEMIADKIFAALNYYY